jgi:2-amino-4-hydroxy-6-hydroxymethyldihydropteridine diphosphokinase
MRQAPVYRTEALYLKETPVKEQPDFLNTAVCGLYEKLPYDLLKSIHSIEASFGRDRSKETRWGERSLDIDILLFGGTVVSDAPDLEIPHPRLKERRFALIPLLDLLPGARDPVTGIPYRIFLNGLSGQRVEQEEVVS